MHDAGAYNTMLQSHPVAVQLLGVCPLLLASHTLAVAIGLALVSLLVLVSSNAVLALLRNLLPERAQFPATALIIATFTVLGTRVLEAYAFGLYEQLAVFIQALVANALIDVGATKHGRQPLLQRTSGVMRLAAGTAVAMLVLGATREILAFGTLLRDASLLTGAEADWQITIAEQAWVPLLAYGPGGFIVAGLLLALVGAVRRRHD
ncbi:MAG: Rnf-Nqr domain containing protein [Pseudomonadota bacterium]